MMHVMLGQHRVDLPPGASLMPIADELAVLMMMERAAEPVPALYRSWVERLGRRLHRVSEARPWSILRVKPNMERRVRDALSDEGLRVYVPVERYRPARTWRSRTRPLMPGYIFAELANDTDLDLARSNHAVQDVMCRDGAPVKVAALLIGSMVLAEAMKAYDRTWEAPPPPKKGNRPPRHKWKKGELARVIGGPFSGFNAIIESAERADRMEAFVSCFGRSTPLTLDEEMLEPLA